MTIEELGKKIEEVIRDNEDKYECFGVRVDYTEYEPGDICETSHELRQDYYDWMDNPNIPETPWKKVNIHGNILWDGGDCGRTYCCLVDDLEHDLTYPGDHIHLIASDGISRTDADKEYMMSDPVCLASWKKEEVDTNRLFSYKQN